MDRCILDREQVEYWFRIGIVFGIFDMEEDSWREGFVAIIVGYI